MTIEKADIICDRERFQRAQILLDLFEKDCGRAAVTLKEVGVWALRNHGHLDLRIEHRLAELVRRNSEDSKRESDAVISFRRPPRGWRSLRGHPTRGRNFLRRIFGREPLP
jgi:hypothetical protein